MVEDTNPRRSHLSRLSSTNRRRFLALTGGAVAGLAGCVGGGRSNEGATMTHVAGSTLPEDYNMSPYGENWPSQLVDFANDRLFIPYNDGEVGTPALESWDYNADELVLTEQLRDDLAFWNGDQYTAEDMYVWEEMNRLMSPDGSQYEEIWTEDDVTIKYRFKEPKNPALIETTNLGVELGANLHTLNADTWRPYLEDLQDASSDSARDEVASEILELDIGIEEYIDEGLGTGAYEIVDWSMEEITFEPADSHRHSDDVEIDQYKELVATGSAESQMITNQEVDLGTVALEDQYASALPDHYQNIAQYPSKFMYKVMFNWNHTDALADRAVRRAMAAVINTDNVVTNFETGFPIDVHTGIEREWNNTYIGDDVDDYIDYAPKSTDHDLADEFLEQGGYSREDGTIYDPDGNELDDIVMMFGSDGFFNVPGQTVSSQLQEYGFPIEVEGVESTTANTRRTEDMDWGITLYSHYAADTLHPVSFFRTHHLFGLRLASTTALGGDSAAKQQIQDWLDEGRTHSPYNGKPLVWEVPTEIGQQDLSGETEEINLHETVEEIRTTDDTEWTDEQIKKLTWLWNFHMPAVDILYRESGHWANTQDFDWPIDDRRLKTNNGPYPLIKDGTVGYK